MKSEQFEKKWRIYIWTQNIYIFKKGFLNLIYFFMLSLSCFSFFRNDGTTNSIVGSAKAKNPAEPAKLEVSFFESEDV